MIPENARSQTASPPQILAMVDNTAVIVELISDLISIINSTKGDG